jgi:hypothetical protein
MNNTRKPRNLINKTTGIRAVFIKLDNGDVKAQTLDIDGTVIDQGVMSAADARHQAAQDRKHGFVAA